MKTIKLNDRPRGDRPERISDILTGALLISILLFARDTLNGAHTEAQTIIRPTAQRPIIIVATPQIAPPTAVPVVPEVIYITLPTPEPEVIYVPSPPEVVYVPSPPETIYVEVAPAPAPAVAYIEAPAVATPEPPEPLLQTFALPADEEPMGLALMREAMDR